MAYIQEKVKGSERSFPIIFCQLNDKLEFARRAGGQVVTNVVYFRFLPFNLGMIATGNH